MVKSKKVGIVGYGNQGRAHALNLRDSGIEVHVATRSTEKASADGFQVESYEAVAQTCDILMFLLPDSVIPQVYQQLSPILNSRKTTIGFAHGFTYHFKWIEKLPNCQYFLVAPKGAGAVLRDRYTQGTGLPGVYAVDPMRGDETTRQLAKEYAAAIKANIPLVETTFQEEVECDLFGEQVVLCGGLPALMEQAFEVAVEKGLSPEMAFFECCYEAKLILDLWLKFGPKEWRKHISPTANYGGLTRGERLVTPETKEEMRKIFDEIRSGKFAAEMKRSELPKNESITLDQLQTSYQKLLG